MWPDSQSGLAVFHLAAYIKMFKNVPKLADGFSL